MAERRMFTDKITDADAFTSMPSSAQALYLHINMHADDDGFCNQLKLCKVNANASEDDLKLLIAKNYIFFFESGVVVVKHWRMHNLLRKDRYKETQFTEEKSRLYLKENGAYTFDKAQGKKLLNSAKNEAENPTTTDWQPNGNQMAPQDRIGKGSVGKDKKEESKEERSAQGAPTYHFQKPTIEEVTAYCVERKNNVNPERFIDFYTSKGWKVGKQPMKDWKACIRTWENEDKKPGKREVYQAQASKYDRQE